MTLTNWSPSAQHRNATARQTQPITMQTIAGKSLAILNSGSVGSTLIPLYFLRSMTRFMAGATDEQNHHRANEYPDCETD